MAPKVTVALTAVLGAVCASSASQSGEAAKDVVQIIEIDPPAGTELERGRPIAIEVVAYYELNSTDEAFLSLRTKDPLRVRQDARGHRGKKKDARVKVSRGKGTKRLVLSMKKVPDQETLVVLVALLVRAPGHFRFGHDGSLSDIEMSQVKAGWEVEFKTR